ncbi:hypothetical protein BVRB_5g099390 [Beta vulgaris subsp. vulgaris]|nr:hypothetical protein BVRB_5g099390 [Beta vulgaris subsp. vulgaris]
MPKMFEKFFNNGGKHLAPRLPINGGSESVDERKEGKPKFQSSSNYFQMPVHYPRYKKADYEKMVEWQIDCLLASYGLPVTGTLEQKRKYAIGVFIWE